MKKAQWSSPKNPVYILGHKAIKHTISKETTLYGKYGELWEHSLGMYGIRIWNYRKALMISRKYHFNRPVLVGDELIIVVPEIIAKSILKLIKLPRTVNRMKTWANESYGIEPTPPFTTPVLDKN